MKRKLPFRKQLTIYFILFMLLFFLIGTFTTTKQAHRWSSTLYTKWTSHLGSEIFMDWLQKENSAFQLWRADIQPSSNWKKELWSTLTNIQFTNFVRFLRTEYPGFATYEHEVIVANEETNAWQYVTAESGPPLEQVMKDREAVDQTKEEEIVSQDVDKKSVFIYNSHNRESFLPHLPNEKTANDAYHEEVNITKISERLASLLEKEGIGTITDQTDIMEELHERGWTFGRSYDVSREVVETAIADHDDLNYFFDIHRDSLTRDKTTVTIEDKEYATILFVIGAEHKNYEKNLALATELHEKLNQAYPNISRGVITKEGANANGIYNQDLNDQAILIEVGGHENTLDEMYETSTAFARIFSDHYWNAIKVDQMEE